MIKNKGTKILILSLTFSGLLSTGTGIVLNNMKVNTSSSKIDVKVIEKQVARLKSNVPVLKDLEVIIDEPISVDVKDYISNIDDISPEVLRLFKLDTSLVNVSQPGKYTYYIQYNNKKYNGSITIKEKEEKKKVNTLHIKNFSIKVNDNLPTDYVSYIEDDINTLDVNEILIDTSKVDIHVAGDYQYTITYGKMMYTGTIKVYQEQPTQVLNEIKYNVTYVCGDTQETVSFSKTSTTKSISLSKDEVLKNKPSLSACTSEIDTTKTRASFPITIENGGGFKVFFKEIPQTPVETDPAVTPSTNQ